MTATTGHLDGCPECMRRDCAPHTITPRSDGTIEEYRCPSCSCVWTVSWIGEAESQACVSAGQSDKLDARSTKQNGRRGAGNTIDGLTTTTAKESQVAVSKRTRFQVLSRDRFTCRYCGAKAPEVKLHVDHIIPRSRGGSDSPWNLTAACEACNLSKSAHAVVAAKAAEVRAAQAEFEADEFCAEHWERCAICSAPFAADHGTHSLADGALLCDPCSIAYQAGWSFCHDVMTRRRAS